jgi:ketosteroid isomerase-like protein
MLCSRCLRWIASVAAVVLLLPGCGNADDADDADDAEAEVLSTVEGFGAAVNAYDTEAIREYVTDDCTWQSTGPVQTLDEYLAYVDAHYERLGFHVEVASDPVVSLDGDEYVVVQQDAVKATGLDTVGTSTIRLVEVDGSWLIREVRWVEEAADSTG